MADAPANEDLGFSADKSPLSRTIPHRGGRKEPVEGLRRSSPVEAEAMQITKGSVKGTSSSAAPSTCRLCEALRPAPSVFSCFSFNDQDYGNGAGLKKARQPIFLVATSSGELLVPQRACAHP